METAQDILVTPEEIKRHFGEALAQLIIDKILLAERLRQAQAEIGQLRAEVARLRAAGQ